MNYNVNFWNKYSDKNQDKDVKGIADFIYHTCVALNSEVTCEIGCNVGNNLASFPKERLVWGFDMNSHAVEMASKTYPHISFMEDNILNTTILDNTYDLVFTRGLMIHLTKDEVATAVREMMRITRKYIFHLEYYGKDGESIPYDVGLWKRNMAEYYKYLPVTIISDCDIPIEIDSDRVRFTLVKVK